MFFKDWCSIGNLPSKMVSLKTNLWRTKKQIKSLWTNKSISDTEAVFLGMCDPIMNELWAT